ncbi:N-acetyllactosaminide beta-1,3-N-acetylglucosaminyltransferase 3-like [Brienomyrus brachyistius]|uniref:N-acetyllactosaminide beta-1,3-N-acetylglucosaminyltransferase 3-like n=1 Tax=Brienomyrus brachyistius TaxID=42636 RepID=UPI0020B26CBD|nr:N-acetyllactosaminide beta-1,3-N-acetylglucosaminyltransferase 3-like [Brienomyrus brachyistius]XP_048832327.1 N-acetyllactosaminide beta-1,3-N-acetylglucosaminyltransferase 3-like [Brienomyrus brachyistius]XP_048832328.1 N-acetyllactosaminide beta-1,3-N-acetylglucosaminyltransferase 3-like [Brienomyrus brachyistius]
MRRSSSFLEIAALFVISALCLFIIFKKDLLPHDTLKFSTNEQPPQNHIPMPARKFSYHWEPCTRNDSAHSIPGFSTLPGHIQNFLYYRHCRHFPMLLDVPHLCGATPEESANVFLLLVIKSSPLNYDRREVLRKTWAKERLQDGVWIRRVFLSGVFGSGEEQRKLNKLLWLEHQENNDILQWDFNDSFFNLTLKQVLFLEWMMRNCPQVHFLLNGDDDIFANTDNMVEYLQNLKDNDGNKHLFTGHLIHYVGPIREPGSKYYVPVQVQESNSYPPYCGGGGFLLSGFTATVIYNMSHSIDLLPIDDVYMGMCLEKAGLEPVSHFGVRTAGLHVPSLKADKLDPCYYREIMLVHRFLPHQIFTMWHEIHDPKLKCGKSHNVI